jgi:hypothetical protein
MALKNLYWVDTSRRNSVSARIKVQPRGHEVGITDRDMEEIAQWCEEHNCGRRTSFDTFQFRTLAQKTMFLLKWS